ncbi:MAG: TlpA family protein disulfide reductase [Ktedonobacteraceae bacterium]|nr:TlpA family protein disulfide reductase [Ktedonobacteraceae bacterium]MBO0791001.1 TlpA family protein disulfide reductase [Ktedonobacteraceae bacterium]
MTGRNITRIIAAAAALGTLVLIVLGLLRPHTTPTTTSGGVGLEKGQAAPNFTVTTISGQKVSLSDFRGKPVMLNFWFVDCPACQEEAPDLQKFYAATKNDIVILGINIADSHKDVRRFANQYRLTYPLGLDADRSIASLYSIQFEPTSYFLDSRGIIRARVEGALDTNDLEQLVKKVKD